MISILIINLSSAKDRMAYQIGQMQRLGLAFERLDAVSSAQASAMRDPAYWNTWERPLRDNEKACMLSHVNAWIRVVAQGKPMLIIEDDALLSNKVPALLQSLEGRTDMDFVNLEVRGKRKLMSRTTLPEMPELRRLYHGRRGSAAYIVWPSGARKLLAATEKHAGLADALLSSAYYLHAYQTDPAYAMQLDMCEYYGLHAQLETASSIGDGGKPDYNIARSLAVTYKARRIWGQIRILLRRIATCRRATLQAVDVNLADFEFSRNYDDALTKYHTGTRG
ncbi:glycosyltransferase family 25 protein [Rhizobium sp. CFBP 8762]|uniref:glycosyltransferase family 25 protein n=1 Tax=Rhizobium sp. CFBP 8762 TaxID=2775279 RepID=UPI00177AA42A|nr:glycosyltransferase family 25 protein [Rhizobium sp. CFBP 8762]